LRPRTERSKRGEGASTVRRENSHRPGFKSAPRAAKKERAALRQMTKLKQVGHASNRKPTGPNCLKTNALPLLTKSRKHLDRVETPMRLDEGVDGTTLKGEKGNRGRITRKSARKKKKEGGKRSDLSLTVRRPSKVGRKRITGGAARVQKCTLSSPEGGMRTRPKGGKKKTARRKQREGVEKNQSHRALNKEKNNTTYYP